MAERPTKMRRVGDVPTAHSDFDIEGTDSIGDEIAPSNIASNATSDGHEPAIEAPVIAEVGHDVTGTSTNTTETQTEAHTEAPKLSKNAQKRLRKQQEWDAKRLNRAAERKEKRHEKQQQKREARATAIANGESIPRPPPQERVDPIQVPLAVVIDCAYDDLMRDHERKSLGQQLTHCYSYNRKAPYMPHLAVSSFAGQLKERYDTVLDRHYEHWRGMRFLSKDFVATADEARDWMSATTGGQLAGPAFARYAESHDTIAKAKSEGEVIYLSSDSDYTLTELKPYSTYIIGGLVDKNREKGICHKSAVARGVKTARLPIGEYLSMSSRKVLTTNHVHHIILKWLELGDWAKAFMEVIPKRKDAKIKGSTEDDRDEDNDDAEPEDEEDVGEMEAIPQHDREVPEKQSSD